MISRVEASSLASGPVPPSFDLASKEVYENICRKVRAWEQAHGHAAGDMPRFTIKINSGHQYYCYVCDTKFAITTSKKFMQKHSDGHVSECRDTDCDKVHLWSVSYKKNCKKPCPWDKTREHLTATNMNLSATNITLQAALALEHESHQQALKGQRDMEEAREASEAAALKALEASAARCAEAERALDEAHGALRVAEEEKRRLVAVIEQHACDAHSRAPAPREARKIVEVEEEAPVGNMAARDSIQPVDDILLRERQSLATRFLEAYGGEILLENRNSLAACVVVDSPYADALVGGRKRAEGRTKRYFQKGQWWVVFASSRHPYARKRQKALGMCLVSRVLSKDSEDLQQAPWYAEQVEQNLVHPGLEWQHEVSVAIEFGVELRGLCDDKNRHKNRRGKW